MLIRIIIGCLVLLGTTYFAAFLLTPWSQFARLIVWRKPDVFNFKKFPIRVINNDHPPFYFKQPECDNLYSRVFKTINIRENGKEVVCDFEEFLESTKTTAFIVIKDDVLIYEKYFNGHDANSAQTSFSVTKSFLSALVGIAIDKGYIEHVDNPITKYIPELREKDERFSRITIKHLLTMTSGIKYERSVLPWSDNATTFYSTNLRASALKTQITEDPGKDFLYNNYNPQLIGIILERVTGLSVSEFLEKEIWKPLGMVAPGSWSLDSKHNGFEKMEGGINGLAIDFAKFGRLFLNKGNWNGRQIISRSWVEESTSADTLTDPSSFYQYYWWINTKDKGNDHDHYYASGMYGQFIYIIPEQSLIMVRFGTYDGDKWPDVFENLAVKIGII